MLDDYYSGIRGEKFRNFRQKIAVYGHQKSKIPKNRQEMDTANFCRIRQNIANSYRGFLLDKNDVTRHDEIAVVQRRYKLQTTWCNYGTLF